MVFARRSPHRRLAVALAVAVAVLGVATAALLLPGRAARDTAAAASCVAPALTVEDAAAPLPGQDGSARVVRGHQVAVRGVAYLLPCQDTVAPGQGVTGPAPQRSVPVTLSSSSGQQVAETVGHPDDRGSFRAVLTVPAGAPLGPATLHDGEGGSAGLVVVAQR